MMASTTLSDALKELNVKWFTKIKPRWVDIIGSYAGKELFLIDGDALIQVVLDDRLLGLGKEKTTDWQIVHAIYSLEAFLYDLQKRGAEFDIAFFQANRNLAIGTSSNQWISSSRAIAHKYLKAYIESLEFDVYEFEDLQDSDWKEYVMLNKPLFILSNDHSIPLPSSTTESGLATELLHRAFIKEIHEEGLLLASIRDVDFRDSQANTFLYDSRQSYSLPESITSTISEARELLSSLSPPNEEEDDAAEDIESWPLAAAKNHLAKNPSPSSTELALLFALLAHVQLLDTIELEFRSQPAPSIGPSLAKAIQEFLLPLWSSLEKTIPAEVEEPPLIDGRIFSLVVVALIQSSEPQQLLGNAVWSRVMESWKELNLSPPDFGVLQQLAGDQVAHPANIKEFNEFSLYPFNTPVLADALASVDVPVKPADSFDAVPSPLIQFSSPSIFAPSYRHQTYRTPIPKHLGGDLPKPKDKKGIWKQLRKIQRDMMHIERQAGSLTGAQGAKLEAEVIVPTGINLLGTGSTFAASAVVRVAGSVPSSRTETPDVQVKGTKGKKAPQAQPGGAKGKGGGGGKNKKEPPMKSADKLRMQIGEQKKAKSLSDGESWWKNRLSELSDIAELSERIEMIDLMLRSNKRLEGSGPSERSLAANVRLYRISCEAWKLVEDPKKGDQNVRDGYTVRLIKMTLDMRKYGGEGGVLTPTMVKCLWSLLEVLGFEDYVEIIPKPAKGIVDKKLEWDFIKFYRKSKSGPNAGQLVNAYPWMAIREDPIDWQLRVFGEHMDRSFDSKPDSRVRFDPDKWQRDVLDKLDKDESVLVVAPTSAGKTFISYYAMKQVLTASDDGILVYVAPTKALVTQITAEVYARYRKDMKGRSCWAIHTSDIRMNNPQTCQILVTVPEILAFMLLQPNLAKLWTPRIRRIILDEIHTLGSQAGGIWEQILLLARCPIIGLSATVGDAEAFNEWLKSIQNEHGHEHTLIQHQHRYSHLRKFTYNFDTDPDPLDGLPTHKPSPQLRFLHPISFIRPGIKELPSDLALEARDCATLYKAMAASSKDSAVAKLQPTRFFEKHSEDGVFLQQSDVIKYEEALKKQLTKWLQEDDAHLETSLVQKVVKQLSDKEVGSEESQQAVESEDLFYGNLVNMLADLNASGDLPALLFHFDRYKVESIARAILERLKKDEMEWRKTSPEWEKKIKGWQAWEAGAKEREKAAQRAALKKEKAEGDKMERLQNSASVDTSPLAIYANFDPDAPSEEFSFINWGSRYSASELDEDIKYLDRASSTPKFLLECLRRGVAVHHSGLAKGYRVLVETLFRIGFCRVVVSTEDLALGVNMPAKASVFCGDSPALTALMYRQCAGRAGRRGFDLLGKVIFYGLPHERVKQVVLSRLPALRGNYPLTPTLSLRLINLLTDSGYAPSATNAVRDLLKLDNLTVGSDISRDQTLFNMRFSIEYLIRTRTLDSAGAALHPWYNFATFLYSNEPANFALLSLFRSGYIHKICDTAQPNYNIIDAKRNLMHILSFLFCREYISKTNFDKEIFGLNNRTPSKVILPELDPEVYQILREHNNEVLTVFTECAITYAIQYGEALGTDNVLPLSGRTIEAISSPSPFVQGLKSSRTPVRSRSAFVATSGHGDVYDDVDELVRTARNGVHLTKHVLPSLDILEPEDTAAGRYINAYLYDFYMHGQDKPLSDANGIAKGQVWYLLLDFSYAMDGMVVAIRELLLKDTRRVEDDMTSVAGESVAVVQDDWAAAPEDEVEKDEVAAAGPNIGGPVEKERGDDVQAIAAIASGDAELVKPEHVTQTDWDVYTAFVELQKDFYDKFRAMWA